MVTECAVYGCNNSARGDTKKLSYYGFPYSKTISVKTLELATKRRKLWYQFLKRKDINFTDADLKTKRICSVHFVGGKPADLNDTTHVDWVPSLKAPTKKTIDEKIVNRYQRWKGRTQNEEEAVLNEIDPHPTISTVIPPEVERETFQHQVQKLRTDNLEQLNLINKFKKENENQLNCITYLKKQIESWKLENKLLLLKEEAFINQDDEKIKFYSGLPNLDMFYLVMSAIQESLYNIRVKNLDN